MNKRSLINELNHTTSYLRGANLEVGVRETAFVQQLVDLAVLHWEIADYSMRLASL